MGGIQYLSGEQDGGPTRVGCPSPTSVPGMFAAYAVVAALFWREPRPGAARPICRRFDAGRPGGAAHVPRPAAILRRASRPAALATARGIAPYEMFKPATAT